MRTSHGKDLLPQGNPDTSVGHPLLPMIQNIKWMVKYMDEMSRGKGRIWVVG